jgi:hypothetical protein
METEVITEDIINLVIARLKTIPENARLSVGNSEQMQVADIIDQVRNQTEIGKQVIETQLFFLRSLSNLPS